MEPLLVTVVALGFFFSLTLGAIAIVALSHRESDVALHSTKDLGQALEKLIDAVKGIIYRLPGGAITSGQTVHVAYTYTPVSFDEILLGNNAALVNKQVEFIHTSPVSGDVFHYCYWKCQGTGNLDLSFKKQEFMIITADLVAIPDAVNHPTCPTGFMRRVPAAQAASYLAGITIAA